MTAFSAVSGLGMWKSGQLWLLIHPPPSYRLLEPFLTAEGFTRRGINESQLG